MNNTRTPDRPAGWAAIDLFRSLWRDFRAAARDLPRAAWIAWLKVLALGTVIISLVSLALTLWARWAEPGFLSAWDRRTLEQLLASEPISFHKAIILESPGNQVGMLLLLAAVILVGIMRRRPLVVAGILAAYFIASSAFWVGWGVWNRERPDLVLGGVAAPGLHSFPSGHMVHVAALYGYLTLLWCGATRHWGERIVAVLLYAVLLVGVSLARLMLGTHWPSDILAGTLLGLLWAGALFLAQRAAERAAYPASIRKMSAKSAPGPTMRVERGES